MDYTHLLAYLVFLFLWMASPGPCFALVARNSIKHGIKGGIFTCLGMVACDAIFITFAVIGVAEFLKHYPKVLSAGKMIGAAYIFYIGVEIFLTTFKKADLQATAVKETSEVSGKKLFIQGFLTDAANPLLIIGMLAIVLRFIDPAWSAPHIAFYAALIPITTIYVTFSLSLMFGNPIIRGIITPYMKWFERFAGIAIAALAIMMLLD